MKTNLVNGAVAIVAITGVVILILRDANPNTLVLAVIMIANALGIGYNNKRTENVAQTTAVVAASTNGVLHTLSETVQEHHQELVALREEDGKP